MVVRDNHQTIKNPPDELIDIDRVEGRTKTSSLKKIEAIIEKHPEESLSIIRNWMYLKN